MSAQIHTAVYAWCSSCSEGSDFGYRAEAEAWAAEHDKLNHLDD